MPEPSPRRSLMDRRGLLLAGVLVAMLFTSVYPLGRYLTVRGEIASLERQDQELNRKAVELARERERLKDPVQIERLARERLGYVRPGEVPFAIVDEAGQADVPPRIDLPEAGDRSVLERWWSAIRRAVTTF